MVLAGAWARTGPCSAIVCQWVPDSLTASGMAERRVRSSRFVILRLVQDLLSALLAQHRVVGMLQRPVSAEGADGAGGRLGEDRAAVCDHLPMGPG